MLQQQEMPGGMSGSGSADKALGAIPTDPSPDWKSRPSHYLPNGVRVVRAGETRLTGVTLPFVRLGGQSRN